MKHCHEIEEILFIVLTLFVSLSMSAQEINVKSIELVPSDLTARTNPRLDGNDEPCALIKVIIPSVEGMQFEGWVIGNIGYLPGEYQVYVPAGTKKITFRHPNFAPGEIRFTFPIEGKCTYRVTLEAPQGTGGLESVEKGDAASMLKMAQNYENGTGAYSKSIQQALEWYEKAAEAGNFEAQEYLADVLWEGKNGFQKNENKALNWNEVCAKRGNEKAILRTAQLYQGMKFNLQAISWYTKYNELHPTNEVQMQIAQLHDTSSPNRNTWLKVAADNGHIEAAYELATRLAPTDQQTAAIYYQKAVDANHIMAMNDYGTYLMSGKYGFVKNIEKGKFLVNRAIDGGTMGAGTSIIKTSDDMARYVLQIPTLLNSAQEGDPEAILTLLLIYKAIGDEVMLQKMSFVALYNFGYDVPTLVGYDETLLTKAGLFFSRPKLIDHYDSKSRTIRVYSYPKTEYYKEAVYRKRISNYEFIIDYLCELNVKEKTYDELNSLFHATCQKMQYDMNIALEAINTGTIDPSICRFARSFLEEDIMNLLEKEARENGKTAADDGKYEYGFLRDIQKRWGIPRKLTTTYDIRIIHALIDYRKRTKERNWKKEIKWLEEWLQKDGPRGGDSFYPWLKQLKEERFLWDEQKAKNAFPIVEQYNKERIKAAAIAENDIKQSGNKAIRGRAQKAGLTTLEANGVAFNVVFIRKGQIGRTGNYCSHDFHVMETPVSVALWNALMGKKIEANDYNVYKSANYQNWMQKKKYYGNIWQHYEYNMKPEDVTDAELNEFIFRLNSLTKKKFRLIMYDESRLISTNNTKGVYILSNAEDFLIDRRSDKDVIIRLAY